MTRTSEPVDGERTAATTTADPQPAEAPAARSETAAADRSGVPGAARGGRPRWEGRTIAVLFLAPALLTLAALVVYPILYTIWLSLHNADGSRFVGLDNYVTMFTAADVRKAITNNVIWVVVAPSLVTIIGLILAVLTERVRMATAFKTILFMPMAISFLAAGVTFRMVYDESPDRGAANAFAVAVHDMFRSPSPYHGTSVREGSLLVADADGALRTAGNVDANQPVLLPLVGLPEDRIPSAAAPAAATDAGQGLRGVVWLDFTRGGGGTAGVVDPTERGLPAMAVEALRDGAVVGRTTTAADGRFSFPDLTGDGYQIRLAGSNFTEPFAGVTWLGPSLVTPAIIGAYIWIWAGFAMVLISAGLAAIPRDALEAARMDGATEWQVFRLVTAPLVRPVLTVVFVTLVINVLKIFDLILVIAPESSQDDANVVALEMYRVSFGGGLDFGLGSALGVLLFLLVLPAMLLRIRSMRKGVS
ncbi:ABC transporter permease subunit [Plantactinospora sp. B5E13]|uniref:ABC transporter permease n=1 Tax=unclassified Plantactinospora TaxID=2631981 RepID=UPI00325EB426